MRLTKYEKETIILTSEGDDTYSVYTFNAALKRRQAIMQRKMDSAQNNSGFWLKSVVDGGNMSSWLVLV